jgi:hypothetical protein
MTCSQCERPLFHAEARMYRGWCVPCVQRRMSREADLLGTISATRMLGLFQVRRMQQQILGLTFQQAA